MHPFHELCVGTGQAILGSSTFAVGTKAGRWQLQAYRIDFGKRVGLKCHDRVQVVALKNALDESDSGVRGALFVRAPESSKQGSLLGAGRLNLRRPVIAAWDTRGLVLTAAADRCPRTADKAVVAAGTAAAFADAVAAGNTVAPVADTVAP